MASRGVNKVILIGNLGGDPETRYFPDGGAVTSASIATSETWKDKSGEQQERTEWHRCVFRDRGNYKLGEIAGEYLKKGAKVYIEGKLATRKWQDKDGKDRYVTEVIVETMQMLSGHGADGGQQQKSATPEQRRGPDTSHAPQADYGNFDDDIPF